MQPPAGPPVWTALNGTAVDDPAADVEDDLAQGRAHRHFDEPGVDDPAGEREDLGALARRRPDRGEPVAAVADDRGDVGEGLDVVDEGRPVPQAGDGRIRGPRGGRPAAALDRGDESRLLAADERAGSEPDVDLERELGVHDGGAEVAGPDRVPDRLADPADDERVLAPAVDVAEAGADRVRRDRHPLEDPVRVALEDAPVHERARVALVGVADDVLRGAGGLGDGVPLEAGRVAGAAAAAQPAPASSPRGPRRASAG